MTNKLREICLIGWLDRFEGKQAVIIFKKEEGVIYLPSCILPTGAEEGSKLQIKIILESTATRVAKRGVKKLINQLDNKSKKDKSKQINL